MDQWTIDCLQKYVGEEVFTGMKPKPMLLIELDGAKENLKFQSKLIEKWLQQEALEFRKSR